MPNGDDKNLMRLYEVVDGFRRRFGRWPTTIRLPQFERENLLEGVLTEVGRDTLLARLDFVTDEERFCAEDASGARYAYLSRAARPNDGEPSAAEWLGVDSLTRHGAG
jgi:hypothetical protein